MSENEANDKKPARGLRFYLKVLAVFTALIAVSVFIAVYYVYHHLTADGRLEGLIMEKAGAATGMEIKFSGYELAFPSIAINNLSVATDTPDLKLDAKIGSLTIRPDLWAAINGEFMIESLSVASVTTAIEIGNPNAAKKLPESGKDPQAPFDPTAIKLPFNNIDFHNVRLSVLQRETSTKHEIIVKNANLARSLLSSSMPFSIEGEVVDLATLVADGKLYWPANISSVIKIKTGNMAELKKFVPAEYHQQFDFVKNADLEVELKYSHAVGDLSIDRCQLLVEPGIKADATLKVSSFSPLNVSAVVKVAPVDIPTLWPLVKDYVPAEHGLKIKSGKVAANIEVSVVDAKAPKILVHISPENIGFTANVLPEPVQLSKGTITYDDGKISFSDFSAKFAESTIGLKKGSVVISPLNFSGDVNLSANLESIRNVALKYISDEAKTVLPSGKVDFAGKIAYDSKGVRVDGQLLADKIGLKESKTGAQASIEKVKVSFVDLSSAKGQIKIDNIEVKGVGASVQVRGAVTNASDMGFDIKANGNLNIEEFSKMAGSLFKLPVRPDQFKGGLTLDVTLGGTMKNLKPGGKLVLNNVSANLSEQGLIISGLNGAASADLDKLVVENLSAELLGGKVKISGSFKDFKNPVVDAKAEVTAADLDLIRKLIKKNVPDMPDEIEFSGKTDLTVNLTGKIAEPVIKGEATLAGVRFFHPAVMRPVENIAGPVSFTNNGLTAKNITANWGKSKVRVNGQLKDWAKFISDFKYIVEPLDVTDAAGFFLKDTGYVVQGNGTGNGTITGPIEKIKVDGVASVPVGLVTAVISEKGEKFKFPYKDLTAKFAYTDQIFNVSSADLTLFSGRVNASAKFFLASEPMKFEFVANATDVQTQEFLKENTTHAGVLTGGVNGSFTGRGNTLGLASIDGDANLAMPKGTYNSPPMIKQIADKLNAPQLASGTINNAAGNGKITGGRISSNNIMGTSNHGKVIFLGSIGLDATIDGETRFQINNQACQSSNILRELVGNAEFLEIPISLKGSLMSPSIGMPLDRMIKDAAQRRGKEAVQKEAGKFLDKLLGGGKKAEPAAAPVAAPAAADTPQSASPAAQPAVQPAAQPAPQPTQQQQAEKAIKDLGKGLNKLFKRK